MDDLADTMPYVTYPSGHTDTLEVAVRRCVLTGANQTAAKLQLERADEAGCEFVEVTAHRGARPTHAVWQGKVYHRGGAVERDGVRYEDFEAATGYGTGQGLCGWNCRHNFYPFWPGISNRVYTDDKLEELADPKPYEESQRRRALERAVRKYKRRFLAEQAAEQDTGRTAAKLRGAQQALADFIEQTDGKIDGARTGVQGFGYKQSKAAQEATAEFTEGENRAILNDNKTPDEPYSNHAVTEKSVENIKAFPCETLDKAGQEKLAEAHKELLRQVKDKPLGTEMARCYGLDMQPMGDYVTGDKEGSVKIPDQSAPYIAIHNHPSGLTFSPGDLSLFIKRSNMKMLTAVGNDGTVYTIERTQETDEIALRDLKQKMQQAVENTETKAQVMEELKKFFGEAENHGAHYYAGENTGAKAVP